MFFRGVDFYCPKARLVVELEGGQVSATLYDEKG
ncbi:MAG: DUF559 domain-containing protein [Thermodesulfobacteriota bacterium]